MNFSTHFFYETIVVIGVSKGLVVIWGMPFLGGVAVDFLEGEAALEAIRKARLS